jgi:Mrp family chromosome partitioning ATPase
MPTKEQIQKMLTQVIDPELGKNIVEAGIVRDIQIDAGQVEITLALTMKGCPLKNQLQEQTQAAAEAVPGVESVKVHLTTMTQEEREKLKSQLPRGLNMNRVGQMVAVLSGKGGVGKSSVTALLASSLQRQGLNVGVLDADVTGPSIPKMFGVTGPVRGIPLGIMPIETRTGIKVISTNLMVEEEDMAVVWRGPVLSNTIKQFWTDVAWGRLDYLLIDLPPGTSDATLTVMQAMPLDGVVLVATPQGLSSMVVRKTVNMSLMLDVPILAIVENMSYFIAPETGTKHLIFGPSHTQEIADLAGAPIISHLPIDLDMTKMADAGEIENYEHAACAELVSAFIETVPITEPAPSIPWMAE